MDLIVEKATEIGFEGLIPLETKRTIVKYNHKKKEKKRSRWQRVVEAAAKQSGRAVIPEIKDFYRSANLKNLKSQFDYVLVLWEDESNYSIKKFFKNNNVKQDDSILLIIGPEGGFSESEVKKFKTELGAEIISLGPRILRTETAGIAALTAILYEKGELGD
jgi:16S rRNA (uracil1498-N3)-methyltransferase